ncbi:MAG: zinc-dependent metalloprotease, partial [Planctomycetota bacterium]
MPSVRVSLHVLPGVLIGAALLIGSGRPAVGQAATPTSSATPKPPTAPKPDFPKYADVTKGYEKIVSTTDAKPSLYTILVNKKDQQMLAVLPSGYASQRHFIATTIASGETFAGLQAGEMYVYWKRYGKRLALIEPNVGTRSSGDQESKDSVKRLFTDRVILDVPILTLGPGGAPVIDMDALLVGQASKFFGSKVSGINPRLISVKTAKAFPQNVELGFEAPMSGGRLKTLHYSISVIPSSTGYKPRVADQRVGYFTTAYDDLGKFKDEEKRIRYITRWKLEKSDSSLKLSPPKNPIIFYIEHTTPKRYRYWVKRGILYWNKSFEKVGIREAIEVYQQDADKANPKHMEKDPEDVRYNFIRWLSNDVGTAIGPSRIHPMTGQILDADVILTDGWIRHYEKQFSEVLPKLAMEGFSPQTLAWLNTRPRWDPRICIAPPSERPRLIAERCRHVTQPHGGHPAANVDPTLIGDDEYDGLIGRTSQVNGMCLAAEAKALELAMLRMTLEMLSAAEDKEGKKEDEEKKKEEKKEEKEKEQLLDGIPERFIGPLVAELVAHEVGHTLGLRHNFKGSSVYSLDDISSDKMKGKPYAGSIMDYLPVNMHMKDGKLAGEHTMLDIGPYDMWAIEYGYSFATDLKPILTRVAEPELIYGTDEDTWGPDPRSR